MITSELTFQAMYQYCNIGACRDRDKAIKKGADSELENLKLDQFINELKRCDNEEIVTWYKLYYEKYKTKIKL